MKKMRKKKERKVLFLLGSLFVCAGFPGQMVIARSSGSKTICEKFLIDLDYAAYRDSNAKKEIEAGEETGIDTMDGAEAVPKAETDVETDLTVAAGVEMESGLDAAEVESQTEARDADETKSKVETGEDTAELELEMESGLDLVETEMETEIAVEIELEEDLYKDGSVFTIPSALSDAIGELTGVEMETESETESESETETEYEIETEDEAELAIRAFLEEIRLGADFQIPMAMPDEMGTLDGPVTYSCGRLSIGRAVRVHAWQQEHSMEELEKLIENTIAQYDGTWSVYVKNLNTNESFVINDQPMKSASVMKLFIMGTVYTAIEEGELERTDEIMSLMNAMISYSDNASSNQLLYILGDSSYADGIAKVNAFIQSHGYSEMTVEYNGFSNTATNSGNGINQVAAKDVGQLLEDIYRRTWMSRAVSNEMEEMLLAQHTRTKIPAGLPDDVLCANKTGEMSGTENDAAIIYSDACDYILVVLSNDVSDSGKAISRIASLSELVYEFLNCN